MQSEIEIGALNVVATPHPPGIYLKILELVAGKEVRVWGADYAKITPPEEDKNKGLYSGRILVWTHIDKKLPWIDKEKSKEASEKDKETIVIPPQLDPNYRSFSYGLVETKHLLVIEYKNEIGERFGPSRALKLFTQLFSPRFLGDETPEINITVVPEDSSVSRILKIPRLRKLQIHIERPNPDDLSGKKKEILEKLNGWKAKSQEISVTRAPKAKTLEPDDELKILAEIASTNGYVRGIGKGRDGEPIDESTKEHPRRTPISLEKDQSGVIKFISALRLF